jgi:hypothetical protein
VQLHPGTYPWLVSLTVRLKSIFFHNGASVGYYHGDLNALRDDTKANTSYCGSSSF